jgi:hypothetical protein
VEHVRDQEGSRDGEGVRESNPAPHVRIVDSSCRRTSRSEPIRARAELIHVLRLPDFDRADAIGTFWGHPETRTFGELLIDLEEDKAARAVVFGLLREMVRK